MIEISKELFEAVFEGCGFGGYNKNDEIIYYSQPCNIFEGSLVNSEISIYQFCFKCKEWAFDKGIILVSGYYPNGNVYCSTNNILKGIFNESRADTEVEAIILTCEWILKEISKWK